MTAQLAIRANEFSFGAFFRAASVKLAEYRARRRVFSATMLELANLSDRDLADIGIARSEIHDIALRASRA